MIDEALALKAVRMARNKERERCAQIAELLCDQGRDGYQIAKVIRAGKGPKSPTVLGDGPHG